MVVPQYRPSGRAGRQHWPLHRDESPLFHRGRILDSQDYTQDDVQHWAEMKFTIELQEINLG